MERLQKQEGVVVFRNRNQKSTEAAARKIGGQDSSGAQEGRFTMAEGLQGVAHLVCTLAACNMRRLADRQCGSGS